MNRLIILLLMFVLPLHGIAANLSDDDEEPSPGVIKLNNEAVAAQNKMYLWKNNRIVGPAPNLKDSDYKAIVEKYQSVHNLDPGYSLARKNLAIAHNNFGLFLAASEHRESEALRELHQAVYLDPENVTTVANMEILIKRGLRMIPKSFADRTKLGDQAMAKGDLVGAVVEYRAALKLKNDAHTHRKLGDAYRLLDEKDKAVAEYAAAYRDEE